MSEEVAASDPPPPPEAAVAKKADTGFQEIDRLRRENETLKRRLRELRSGVETGREARRATLNLLEDAVAAREAAEREIGERQRAELALHEANLRKDEFLAMLAHELRNPLAAIHNAGQLLLRSDSTATARQTATAILNRQTAHMVRQVDELLDVSRISRGKIELRKELVEVASVVEQAVETIQPLCEHMGHRLVVTQPPQPLQVHGDRERLAQVVGNLLCNACKFGGKDEPIGLSVEEVGPEVVIRVCDHGIGIAPDDLPRIFEIFAQVGRSQESANDGLGLGLTLVRMLVELHGGRVEAHSAGLGKGSEFVVRLPLSQGSRTTATVPPGAADAAPVPVTSRRVLVVDDNRDVAASLAMVLGLMGQEVRVVHDGLAAIETAAAFRPDIILLDIGMPGMNGYETALRIRELGQDGLTIVALSGWGQEEDRHRSTEAGIDTHLVKPVDMDTLAGVFAGLTAG